MNAKLVLILAGALALGGCNGSDPTVFPYSVAEVQAMLTDAKTTLPRRNDPKDMIKIWSNGRTSKSVTLNMKYGSSAPLLECEAVITSVKPKETRVVAKCGSRKTYGSEVSRMQDNIHAPMFEEHIASTLNKRPFSRANVEAKEAAMVLQTLPGLQREALQMSAEEARLRAQKH